LVKKAHVVRQDPAKFRPASILRHARSVTLDHPVRDRVRQRARSARSAVSVKASRDGPSLRIHVDDDGPGIAPEQRAVVLQRGVRLDESRDGSGLGLAIVSKLADADRGRAELRATPAGHIDAVILLPT
jgi:signal transduction histidine kinase